jgi:hypothetical protein
MVPARGHWWESETYRASIGYTANETGASHLDYCRDGLHGAGLNSRGGIGVAVGVIWASAESIINDLATLRVANQDQLGVRALCMEGVHS